ncbi:abscisic acid-deficient protein Aba4 family protein [Sphingoaurantiacus capsulatus]|uniref:Abscisic acid-deficient protein Aba4 family protein n=1 Tax=Sphingoaurantiacus capsulatus TaxID=1771310 RepID=A0ABV7X4F6_9SPHN
MGRMTLDQYFVATNVVAGIGWLMLLAAPLNRPLMVMLARTAGVLLAVSYVVLFVMAWRSAEGFAATYSLPGIAAFFDVPGFVLVGWIHYLAFDLWVGSWEVEEAGRSRLAHWLVVPCLFFTYLLGPVGLLLFLLLRMVAAKKR